MVKPFKLARIPRILFGPGKISGLNDIVKSFGNRIILVTGEKSFLSTSAAAVLLQKLEEEKIKFRLLKIIGEPTPEIIDSSVLELKDQQANVVVAIGGGSVMDSGKAISAMLHRNESVIEFLEGIGTGEHPGTKIPFIAVPTTSGTGSEATKNAVISRTGVNGFKRSLRHDNFVPDIAVVDPELTINCPDHITAASGMDCFTQLTEAYLSVKSLIYTDALALEALKTVKESLLKSYNNGNDIEARAGMSFAALTSGICLANAGLGVIHGFASSAGGLYEIPHGIICGTLMAVSNELNVRKLRESKSNPGALKKYAVLGNIFLNERNKSDDFYIDGFISYLHELTDLLHLQKLKSSGVEEAAIDKICASTDMKNNPVALDKEDLIEIITRRFI